VRCYCVNAKTSFCQHSIGQVSTCLKDVENLEMAGNLTAVRKNWGLDLKLRKRQ